MREGGGDQPLRHPLPAMVRQHEHVRDVGEGRGVRHHAQERDLHSVLNFTRDVIASRQASSALRRGDFEVLEKSENVLAFLRDDGDESVLCVFNLGHGEAAYHAQGDWAVLQSLENASPSKAQLPLLSGYIARKIVR